MNNFYLILIKDSKLHHIIVEGDWEYYLREAEKCGYKLYDIETYITKDRIKELRDPNNFSAERQRRIGV